MGRSSTVTKPGAVSERLATKPIGRAALEPGTAAIVPCQAFFDFMRIPGAAIDTPERKARASAGGNIIWRGAFPTGTDQSPSVSAFSPPRIIVSSGSRAMFSSIR